MWKDATLEDTILAGRYSVMRLIARGGMGEVYQARDEVLRRDVAIKVIRSGDDPTLAERFTREAYLAARFDHPNVVRIFDLGQTDDGCPFLVMELIRGSLFTEILADEGPMPVPRVVELLEGVADALDLIHCEDVVHRDIKLENLIVTEREDGRLRPKLLDFGVALPPAEEAARLTVDGSFVGTPLYAAPEVLLGAVPDPASDVYSLAVVAYKMLTGTAPFEDLPSHQMLQAKVSEDPRPVSDFRPDLPPAVDELFTRALAREPSSRPATAVELVSTLMSACTPRPAAPPMEQAKATVLYAAGLVSFFLAGLVIWAST